MSKNVLMIDDAVSNLKYYTEILREKYEISCAKSGIIALKFLEKHTPDIIILDLLMPEMDGLETLRRIKALKPQIPVIIMSADSEAKTANDWNRLGAVGFIEKPAKFEEIVETIDRFTKN